MGPTGAKSGESSSSKVEHKQRSHKTVPVNRFYRFDSPIQLDTSHSTLVGPERQLKHASAWSRLAVGETLPVLHVLPWMDHNDR
jgi:hypothetical protein